MAWPRRPLGILSPRWRAPSTCEGCGGAFTCGASLTGCWCLRVTLTPDARTALRQRYQKCVCAACLERAAAEGTPAAD